MTHIVFKPITHKQERRIMLDARFDKRLIKLCKSISYCRYSATLKRWHIPWDKKILNNFILLCKDEYQLNYAQVNSLLRIGDTSKVEKLPTSQQLSKENIYNILANIADDKFHLMVHMSYSLGLRAVEIINVKLSHFQKGGAVLQIANKHGRISRSIALHEELRNTLNDYIAKHKHQVFLFESNDGIPVPVETFYNTFKKACFKANVVSTGIQSLRYSYAQQLLIEGYPVDKIQYLLGHKSKMTTIRFLNRGGLDLNSTKYQLGSIKL